MRRYGAQWSYGVAVAVRTKGTEPGCERTEAVHGNVWLRAPKEPRVSESVLILGHLGLVFMD